ncbi:uncharacterized protein (TIGR03085 family) [Motilibacter rhizosphaerae]|uniref:Uncharacterized protein (TIGR03085 family) n=1 Tax=Motilibacter rhizosphaerae TaxID=598652 RepID=A0A4V2F3F0_9ACTN|nr:TIGR03085 family metal-binding protein [Motilibacter rhizosphaerae]RZS82883.1 uncharacterized protein (TIGR03085 family) [Motilibacter rhizosphaerae]
MTTSYAPAERAALADTLAGLDPAAPTLCPPWRARDLAAHVVLREHRPDAALGIAVRPLAGHTQRVQDGIAAGDYAALVDRVRRGPAPWWPTRIPQLREAADLVELVIHHEDLRRAQPGWEPRELPAGVEDALWARVPGLAKRLGRRAPATVALRRSGSPDVVEVGSGERRVVVEAAPVELLLLAFGRGRAARLVVEPADTPVAEWFSGP